MHELLFSPHLATRTPAATPPRPARRAGRRPARRVARIAVAATVALAAAGLGAGVARADRARQPAVLTITATDYQLTAPAAAAAGLTRIRLVNHGSEGHQAALVRLKDGHTSGDFL